ncbi:MAG: Unknown protein [uncultured Thiotrichaceae bacterium]|uniref:CRISPR associated protein Cas6 C-terminal domain-containing protein n=1 Tax=uncultured Thiotrichaceae bacterium TaxID=298394 RepID=A0A6S6TFG7_9GAMM|nr:MAG: Unknown protein [uncultured Thiotrichaceae bacterium]
MHRVRIQLPVRQSQQYSHYDLLHDALIHAWVDAGASPDMVIGFEAHHWNFAALGYHRNKEGFAHTLVVSTPSKVLAEVLEEFDPSAIRKMRGHSGETVNFAAASISREEDMIPPQQGIMNMLLLSPVLIQDRSQPKKRWYKNLHDVDLAGAVNHRLSRLANRPVNLMVQPDSLYLRANPKHSVCVNLKHFSNGRQNFVIGMQAPLVMAGSEEDLRFAWYAGIGEKTRSGFGCLGTMEQGVGR